MWSEAVVADFKVLFRNLLGRNRVDSNGFFEEAYLYRHFGSLLCQPYVTLAFLGFKCNLPYRRTMMKEGKKVVFFQQIIQIPFGDENIAR